MRQTFGPILLHLGLEFDYVQTAKGLDQSQVNNDIDRVLAEFPVFAEKGLVDRKCLEASSRHYLAMKQLIRQHNLDRCKRVEL